MRSKKKKYVSAFRLLAAAALLASFSVYGSEPKAEETVAESGINLALDYSISSAEAQAEVGDQVVKTARTVYGNARYEMGQSSTEAVDCSSLVQRSYEAAGVQLPRTTTEQINAGVDVKEDELKSGDLLFYRWSNDAQLHVVIYTGKGRAIHASSSKRKVFETRVDTPAWRKRFIKAVRIAVQTGV